MSNPVKDIFDQESIMKDIAERENIIKNLVYLIETMQLKKYKN